MNVEALVRMIAGLLILCIPIAGLFKYGTKIRKPADLVRTFFLLSLAIISIVMILLAFEK